MAVEGVITLGIGSAPGSVEPFITLGLVANEAAAVSFKTFEATNRPLSFEATNRPTSFDVEQS